MKRGDWILIALIIIISFAGMFYKVDNLKNSSKSIEIVVDGKVYKSFYISNKNFTKKILVKTPKGNNYIYFHDGGVEISDADCKDKVCVRTGIIRNKGQIIACLPHKLYIRIIGVDTEVDSATY